MPVAITAKPVAGSSSRHPLWHDKAPRKLVKEYTSTDSVSGWQAWQEHLQKRRKPAPPWRRASKASPLLWSWPRKWQREAVAQSLEAPSNLAEQFLADDSTLSPDLPSSLQLLALAYAMPNLAAELPADTWWSLVDRLHETAIQARTHHVDWATDAPDVVRNQLLAGELPLALSCLFPELCALRDLRDEGRAALSEGIIELTDGQGLPHGRLLPMFGPLFACWTRCRWLGESLRRGAWSRAAELQYEWTVRHAVRLADAGGRFMLSGEPVDENASWNRSSLSTALRISGNRGDCAAAADALPLCVISDSKRLKKRDRPKPSLNSEWAGVTIMADGWSQSAARCAINTATDSPHIEIGAGGTKLLFGDWTFSTCCDGQEVDITGDWEQLCWESGKQFDFLELGVALSGKLRLERQVLFGRKDRILYLADIVVAQDGETHRIEHAMRLPLAPKVHWSAEAETRDGRLDSSHRQAAVLPLALREWRSDPLGGSLSEKDGQLVLRQEGVGRALCCSLFIDLNHKRSQQERTWRQLTVAEWMEVVPPDVAVGYRAQSGADQWLIYRSLGSTGNRTLLGHNIAGEFCAGRFVDGKFKEWIEIEAV